MCSVSSVVEKIPAPSNRIPITAPMNAHQVHLVCLPIVLTDCLDASCQGNYLTVREVLAHIGKIYCI